MKDYEIFKVEKFKDYEDKPYFTIQLCRASDGKHLAIGRYKTNVFDSADSGALFEAISGLIGDEDELVYNDAKDRPVIYADCEKREVTPHYYFTRKRDKKGNISYDVDTDRIVRFVRLVAMEGDSIENQLAAYEARIPDEAIISSSDKDDDDEE